MSGKMTMLTRWLAVLAVVGLITSCGRRQTPGPFRWEVNEPFATFKGSTQEKRRLVDAVLNNTVRIESMTMFIAADTAYELGRLEDAAFLLHAARFRTTIDRDRFPARKQGGESPGIYLAFLSKNAGQVIGPAALQKPDAMLAASRRFAVWDYGTIRTYNPGWEHHGPAGSPETYKAMHSAMAQALLSQAELMQDPEYAALVNSMSDFAAKHFFETLGQEHPSQAGRAEYEQGFQRMVQIETAKGVKGFSVGLSPDTVFDREPLPPSSMSVASGVAAGSPAPLRNRWPALTLTGVLGAGSGGSCIINGRLVSAGDSVEGVRIVRITKDGVVAELNGERRMLSIKAR